MGSSGSNVPLFAHDGLRLVRYYKEIYIPLKRLAATTWVAALVLPPEHSGNFFDNQSLHFEIDASLFESVSPLRNRTVGCIE